MISSNFRNQLDMKSIVGTAYYFFFLTIIKSVIVDPNSNTKCPIKTIIGAFYTTFDVLFSSKILNKIAFFVKKLYTPLFHSITRCSMVQSHDQIHI